MVKWDDGSPEWMDQRVNQRIRRNNVAPQNHNSDSYLDRKVSSLTQGKFIINDQFTKNVVERYTRARHSGPAHLGERVLDRQEAGSYMVNADLEGMSRAIPIKVSQLTGNAGQAMFVEDQMNHVPANLRGQISDIQQSLEKGQSPFPQHSLARIHEVGNQKGPHLLLDSNQHFRNNNQQMNNLNQQGNESCRVLEGHPCYVAVQYGNFGSTIPLVRGLGQINQQISSMQFMVGGLVKAYIVPAQQTSVNMEMIQKNPHMLTELVELIAPPMSQFRSLLVPREAIANSYNQRSQNPNGHQILTDNYQRQQPQQRSMQQPSTNKTLSSSPLGKKMLLG